MTGKLFTLTDSVSLDSQIEELRRERKIRERVYPRWIANGWLSDSLAARHNAALDAAIRTLERLRQSTA